MAHARPVDGYRRERPRYADMLLATLTPFPVVCFTLALLTDLAYWRTSYLMWQHFSAWLLLVGIVVGGCALLVSIIATLTHRPGHRWSHIGLGVLVLALAFLNNLVHARDGWTAVVPSGLVLSALTVAALIASGLMRRASASSRWSS